MLDSKVTRVVWTINGYLLLLVLVAALIAMLSELHIVRWFYRAPDRGLVEVPAGDSLRARAAASQHLEYVRPTRVGDSPYFYSSVYVIDTRHTEDFLEFAESAGDVSLGLIGERINVLFYDEQTRAARPLLETSAAVVEIDAPSHNSYSRNRDEEQQPFILYRIALRDTDGDGRINDTDASRYSSLRPIGPRPARDYSRWIGVEQLLVRG